MSRRQQFSKKFTSIANHKYSDLYENVTDGHSNAALPELWLSGASRPRKGDVYPQHLKLSMCTCTHSNMLVNCQIQTFL